MSGFRCAPFVKQRVFHGLVASLASLLLPRLAAADGQDYHEHVEEPVLPSWFTAPFEYGHAAAWAEGRTGPVYRFTAAVLPGVALDRFSLHLALQALYRNPGWDVGTGGRVTYRVTSLAGGFLPLRVLAEASYLPVSQGAYVAAGGMVGIGGLLQLSALYGHDTDLETNFLGVRLGVDLAALGDPIAAVTRYVPQQDFRPVR